MTVWFVYFNDRVFRKMVYGLNYTDKYSIEQCLSLSEVRQDISSDPTVEDDLGLSYNLERDILFWFLFLLISDCLVGKQEVFKPRCVLKSAYSGTGSERENEGHYNQIIKKKRKKKFLKNGGKPWCLTTRRILASIPCWEFACSPCGRVPQRHACSLNW